MLTGVAPAWVKCGASRTAQVQRGWPEFSGGDTCAEEHGCLTPRLVDRPLRALLCQCQWEVALGVVIALGGGFI
jgi:hypothetical protein